MKRLRACIAAGVASAAIAVTPAMASVSGEGEGYYYIAYSTVSTFPPQIQLMSVGPFAEEEDCLAARAIDQGNGGAWAPYYGSGIQCDWVFHNEVGALQDAMGLANQPGGNVGNPVGQLDAAALRSISTLRRAHDLDAYQQELKRILAPRR